jgi:cysteine synthase A
LFVGPAAALNACAAVKVARKLGPGHNIVTILCDGGDRYISKVALLEQRILLGVS